jgi:8-oxo-dGTP diphosphatase
MEYVAGFLFSSNKEVLLVRKNKPEWQKGRLNGIGGKVEPTDETHSHAMSREFLEEAGVNIPVTDWTEFCTYYWVQGIVHFYYLIDYNNEYFTRARTCTKETIVRVEIGALNRSQPIFHPKTETIYNLKWLIPLALDPSLNFIKTGPIELHE